MWEEGWEAFRADDHGAGLGAVVDTGLHRTLCWRQALRLEALGLAPKHARVHSAELNRPGSHGQATPGSCPQPDSLDQCTHGLSFPPGPARGSPPGPGGPSVPGCPRRAHLLFAGCPGWHADAGLAASPVTSHGGTQPSRHQALPV